MENKNMSRADKKIKALESKYHVGEKGGLRTKYTKHSFFRLYRFILDADRTPIGEDGIILKMADVGLYLLLNFMAEDISPNDGAKIAILNSEHIKMLIKELLNKTRTDSTSSNRIKESFYRLEKLGLIKCNIRQTARTTFYEDITIPFKNDQLNSRDGFFKFPNFDMHTLLTNIKNGDRKFGVKEFLELLGVYTVACLTFYKEYDSKTDKSEIPLKNGIVTVSTMASTRYANRIDFTFGLKLTGSVRKKGIQEYMDILEELGVIVSTPIRENGIKFIIYTFPRNFGQLKTVIRHLY
ncbi:hypothetical protein [Ligilactobacillus salivarius]|uniref:hypothetical protein n=1 Tax=Ligilactobacillus salivarius TaxID=1624 RepID=UPI000BD0E3BB|nr:hypothetical protein [Ligilactobacillus salivarius]PAY51962.1 hypothetical protein A8C37_01095 [Ligilactobacillus salivarius]